MRKFALAGLLVLAPLTAAHADIIPVNGVINGSGPYTWAYTATVTSDETANSGPAPTTNPVPTSSGSAFFTIYDFAGYVSGSCVAPTGWSCTAQNVGFTPSNVVPTSPPDSASLVNLTFAYVSGSPIVGPQTVSGFTAQSTLNTTVRGSFTARATKNTGPTAGTTVDNVGNLDVPGPANGVPEPASLALMGMALVGLGALRRKSAR